MGIFLILLASAGFYFLLHGLHGMQVRSMRVVLYPFIARTFTGRGGYIAALVYVTFGFAAVGGSFNAMMRTQPALLVLVLMSIAAGLGWLVLRAQLRLDSAQETSENLPPQ